MAKPRRGGSEFFRRRGHHRQGASPGRRRGTGRRRVLGYEPLEHRLVLSSVQVRFEFTDTGGQALDELQVGDNFNLNVYIQDVRDDPAGIFQAFFDVEYGAGLISTTGQISHGFFYGTATDGSVSIPGLIDDAGGLDTDFVAPDPAGMELLLFSVPFQANSTGQLSLSAGLPQIPTRQVVAFDSPSAIGIENIGFVGGSIEIIDMPVPEVSIAATQNGNEAGTVPGVFTITQSMTTDSNTVIQYTVDGSADSGDDYTPLSRTATILAGQTSTVINVPVINDSIVEAIETVSVFLESATGDPAVVIDEAADEATLSILDNDTAQVSIAATTNGDEAGPVAGRFTVTQSALSSTNTVVTFNLGGSADSPSDYTAIPTNVTILAGNTTATFDVPVIDDSMLEGPETVVATLTGVSGNTQISLQGGGTQATITIADNDTALVRVETTINPGEGGPTSGVFTFTQSAASPDDTVIVYSLSGSAVEGDDYNAISRTATILAGQTTATVTVQVLNDAIVEADETVIARIDSVTGNTLVSVDNSQRETTMIVADNDSALVRIAKETDGSEVGPTDGRFTVTQTAVSSTNTIVSYTVDGTATAGDDYTTLSGTVTIPAGQMSATIDVPVLDDDESENTETVIVTLGNVSDGDPQIQVDGGQNEATVEIADNETPLVSITTANDADEDGPVTGRFTVSQTRQTATDTVVAYLVSGTAASGEDFTPLSLTATIPAGQTSTTIDVTVLDDQLIEGLETVVVTLDDITGGEENLEIDPSNQQATVEILDDESGLVSIVVTDNGAEAGPASGLFTITQDGITAVDTVISYTVSGTATAGDDYVALSATATIPAGQTSTTITLSVINDELVEPDETVIVTLDAVSEESLLVAIDPQQSMATATIVDNDTAQVRFESTTDGSEDGPTDGLFTIVQSAASSTDTVIQYSIGGSATRGDDYADLSGTVTISAGETTATIDISVVDDIVVEATETVMLSLTTLDTSGARVTIDENGSSAIIEIADNDTAQVSVAKTSDGDESGPLDVVFTVSLTAPSSTETEIQFTIDGTATEGEDYVAPAGSVVIPAGSTSQEVTIAVIDDVKLEGIEAVSILLDSVSGDPEITIDAAADSAAAEIVDNETGLIGVSVTTVGSEAGPTSGQFTVSQNGTTDVDTVISYRVEGSATPGDDYVQLSGTVTIPAGQTSATIDVTVIDDMLIEGNQTVVVVLDLITDGDDRLAIDPAAATATMTIDEDDTGLVSIAADANASETGPTAGSFVVSQSGVADVDTVVSYSVSGTAASGNDFNTLSGTVTIPAGQTSATILVEAIDDGVVEATETVVVMLTGITIGSDLVLVDTDNDTATVEITDNDSAQVRISATTDGNEAGSLAGVFTVTQSAISSTDTVISYTVGGSADSGSDYASLSGAVTIPAGQTSATINVPVIDDTVVEGTETVELTLGDIIGGDAEITVGDQNSDSLDIQDNDSAAIAFVDAASSVFEVSGSHTIVVRLSIAANGTLGQSVTVNVTNTGGTAGASDFTLATTSVTFAAGSQDGAERTVNLTLVDDGLLEPEETILLGLSLDDGTGFPASIGATGTHTVTIIDDPSTGSISGIVWADTNGNGTSDADEIVIPGVTVRLAGVDGFGETVERSTTTDDNGRYSFGELASGTYDIFEQHPLAFNDGGESLGTVAGSPSGQVGNDQFTGVSLGPGEEAVNYDFGEWGLMSQFVNVRFFLSRTTLNDFILRDTIRAAEPSIQFQSATSSQTQIATTSALTTASTATQPDAGASTKTEPNAAPQSAITTSSQVIASAASSTSTPLSAVANASEPAAVADASVVDFLASTVEPLDEESAMDALALATTLPGNDAASDEPGADPLAVVTAEEELPDAGASDSDAAPLLEEPEISGHSGKEDEQLADHALDEEESWLDELVV